MKLLLFKRFKICKYVLQKYLTHGYCMHNKVPKQYQAIL